MLTEVQLQKKREHKADLRRHKNGRSFTGANHHSGLGSISIRPAFEFIKPTKVSMFSKIKSRITGMFARRRNG